MLGQKDECAKDRGLLGIVFVNTAAVLFPLCVEGFLVIGEEGVDLLIRVLLNGAAGLAVGVPTRDAVHGDVAVDENDLELKDLILIEVELFFQYFQLVGGAFGGRVFRPAGFLGGGIGIGGLGLYQGRKR